MFFFFLHKTACEAFYMVCNKVFMGCIVLL